jgi:farnesyl-diphosphate farnesyltransferase
MGLSNSPMTHRPDILRVLEETSRTFFIPITRLPASLQEAIGAAYLCMRAIDEIEDHPTLDNRAKASILHGLSWALQAKLGSDNLAINSLPEAVFLPYIKILPEVTLRISDWLLHIPQGIAPRVWDATIAMADRMAYWADKNWLIQNEADLNSYTFSVAGAVGLLICDIWTWFDGSQIDRLAAIHFGRGLQSVNILRNRAEDSLRGVNFFPSGWTEMQMFAYARKNLDQAKTGIARISQESFRCLVDIPLALAEATLRALENGRPKLTRNQVMQIVRQF